MQLERGRADERKKRKTLLKGKSERSQERRSDFRVPSGRRGGGGEREKREPTAPDKVFDWKPLEGVSPFHAGGKTNS